MKENEKRNKHNCKHKQRNGIKQQEKGIMLKENKMEENTQRNRHNYKHKQRSRGTTRTNRNNNHTKTK